MQYLYGIHAVKASILAAPKQVKQVFVVNDRTSDSRIVEIIELAKQAGLSVKTVSAPELRHLLPSGVLHQGIALSCEQLPLFDELALEHLCQDLPEKALFLILDGIQDPQNVGACLRTANAMGVIAVIAPKNRAAGLTPAAIKVSSGAAALTPFIQVTNLARTMRDLKQQGIWLYGADMNAPEILWQADLKSRIAIVMGNEGEGLRQLTRNECDGLIKIPQYGDVGSMNVSAATAVCLYEVRRQQGRH